jgi:EAL domain-containing protein (putative c-di-GMP-specific phosphodiesterase class I)/DNA-binding NarL/FixJ family response regulator
MTHTVMLADDDPEFRDALGAVVERAGSLELVGVAENALEAIEIGRLRQPDVAVVDVRMPDGGGPRVAHELREAAPRTRVLALSAYGDEATVMQMLDAGAAGYLLKGISAADLVDAIERTANQQFVISPDVTDGAGSDGGGRPAGKTLTVVVADENKEFLEALASIIDRDPDFALVGKARDATTAVRLAALYTPDIALVDASMPGGGGAIAAAQIRRGSPATRVVALSASPERDIVMRMLRAGASSYVVKSVPGEDLLKSLRATALGAPAPSPELADSLVDELVLQLDSGGTRGRASDDPASRVRAVIDGSELTMVFQPIVSIQGHGVVGVEALARFDCEPRQSPDVWFMDAVASGLGTELDLAAARAALAILPDLPDDVDLFVNVVPETLFSSGFEELIATVPGERVVVELTEHAPVHDYDRLAGAIEGLRAEGFRIAVDDVGAGYSSFRHLLTVHPDVLKIDISLCRSIESDRARQVIAASIASLGRELHATVVAEGIETAAELATVRGLGVDSAQGFYLARPSAPPLDALLAAVNANGGPA